MKNITHSFQEPIYDENITNSQWHSYSPFLNSFQNSDIIRIAIQNQNINILPATSLLYIEGILSKSGDAAAVTKTKLINNAAAFLFDEIRYEINGKEIDHNRNVGITSCLKNYISLNANESSALYNASWSPSSSIDLKGFYFNFCIPLKRLLGFAEDYLNIIPNARHEIILTRARNDNNALITTDEGEKPKITISKVQWKVQHISLSDTMKLNLYKSINNGETMKLAFRNWDLYEYPSLPINTTHHIWNVKTTTQLEKPRFIIVAFQAERQNKIKADCSKFDHCGVADIKVYLNSDSYPYEDMNLTFDKNRYALVYDAYANFQKNYYNRFIAEPLLSWKEFKSSAMIIAIDTRHQNENLKTGPVDVRIEIKTENGVLENTSAYCLMLHDRLVHYNPLSGEVSKVI